MWRTIKEDIKASSSTNILLYERKSQQFDILAGVDSDVPSFGLGDSQLCSVRGLAVIECSSDKQRL